MTTTHALYPDRVVLRSGRLADVDERGRAELVTCPWLVQVPSNHPEPDSEADCWVTRDCGAPAFAIDGDADAGWRCSNGHHHYTYGSPRWAAEDQAEAAVEYAASYDPDIARRLDAGESWQAIAGYDDEDGDADDYWERQAEARQEARMDARDDAREWGGEDIPS
jgi:hypothetical protein